MGDLGNLSAFLKEGNVANLDWLDVDEEAYRKEEILPKQNLDAQPDLQALWAREDRPGTAYLVPNVTPVEPFRGSGVPHTMGDMSQEHGHLRARAEEIRKVARLAIMQSPDTNRLKDALTKRFDMDTLRAHRQVLAEVIQERGLLGKFYVDASDFPACATGASGPGEFVRRYARDARYVLAKTACESCACATKGPTGAMTCGVFHKEIQLQVPYTEAIAQAVEQSQAAKGKSVEASNAPPRERIRLAMLAPDGSASPAVGVYTGSGLPIAPIPVPVAPEVAQQQLIQATDLLRKRTAATEAEMQARPIVAFLKHEMLKGLSPEDLAKSLRLAFRKEDLQRTRSAWEPLFKEAGLYGVIYSTQDSFDDCHMGADFLAKHNPQVRALVAGDKCSSCIYNRGRCLMYGKPLVKQASELYTPETVQAVLTEHGNAGRLPPWDTKTASAWGGDVREALKAIHRAATAGNPLMPASPTRMDVVKGFFGSGDQGHVANRVTKREILKQAQRLMNEGIYGANLLGLLKARFEPRDLVAAAPELRQVTAEQGLMGIYYVDPTVYDDYGRGCEEAARLHRARVVKYAKVGPKCGSCVLQTHPGFCSKLSKQLVHEPPYVDKVAQQKAILASGPATETPDAALMNSGLGMMTEYQMQNGGMEIELNEEKSSADPVSIEFNNEEIEL